jgi:hypothetical protein
MDGKLKVLNIFQLLAVLLIVVSSNGKEIMIERVQTKKVHLPILHSILFLNSKFVTLESMQCGREVELEQASI